MTHRLILEVPEEVYQPLSNIAQRTGATPEKLAIEWLTAVSYHAARDPVEGLIGGFRSNVPGWADQHDKHLGEELEKQLRGKPNAGS